MRHQALGEGGVFSLPKLGRTLLGALGLFVLMALLADMFALGYGSLDGIRFFATAHSSGLTFFEFFDFDTDSVLMPIVAALTCVFVGWVIGPKAMSDEIEADGRRFDTAAGQVAVPPPGGRVFKAARSKICYNIGHKERDDYEKTACVDGRDSGCGV